MGSMEILEKYDTLIHIVKESRLPKDEQIKGITEMFPLFDNDKPYNDCLLTDFVWEQYAYSRSLGLSISDAAHVANISHVLIKKLLEGEGLSLEKFTKLIEGELFSVAEKKRKHLSNLDTDELGKDGVKASIAFLEKIYPKVYGPKSTLTYDVDDDIKREWKIEVTNVDNIKKVVSEPKTQQESE